MFALVMSEDRISAQPRRSEIIRGLKALPGKDFLDPFVFIDFKLKFFIIKAKLNLEYLLISKI